jgi:hypothetical protein
VQRLLCGVALLLAMVATPVAQQTTTAPDGWFKAGQDPQDYDVGTDASVSHSGSVSAYVRSRTSNARSFGTLMQTVSASEYLGRRVRLSAFAKTSDVRRSAALWMRVDGPNRQVLVFDNMPDRPLTGTTDWRRAEIVLDVPAEARAISFGILLTGNGQVWVDDLTFGIVGADVPTTGRRTPGGSLPTQPMNLKFNNGRGSSS